MGLKIFFYAFRINTKNFFEIKNITVYIITFKFLETRRIYSLKVSIKKLVYLL